MRRLGPWIMAALIAGSLAGGLVQPHATLAAEEENPRDKAERMARDAMDQLLRAIELLIQSIPQYEMPEVLDNGDIIIRRKRPDPEETPPPEPEFDETTT